MKKPSDTQRGILLRARNGDVIGFDATGLRMNLSDSVIADINRRLPEGQASEAVDPSVLGDIDAWDVRRRGDWYIFTARLTGMQGVRQFRRRVEAAGDAVPDIIADPPGTLFALLSLGGARRATTADESLRFPHHVVTAGDDMGAAGSCGIEEMREVATLQTLTEQTRDSLIADEIVSRRMAGHRALPVIFTRCETDSSGSVQALLNGPAMNNLQGAVANLCRAAATLGVPPKVLAVGLDYTLEDVQSSAEAWRDGMYAVMARITDIFADHGLRKPLFSSVYDAGTQEVSDHPVLRAQWELAWNKAGHDHVFSAAGYMFAHDSFGRPTSQARQQMAEMEAFAIEAVNSDLKWHVPVLLLAEREPNARVIRCRGQGMGAFVIDTEDPLKSGSACGFRFESDDAGAKIVKVEVAEDDSNDLLITCDKAPKGRNLTLCYAIGHPPSLSDMPANRGALRDEWCHTSKTGVVLHRWALPAALPVH
jgi:hypothetical protein